MCEVVSIYLTNYLYLSVCLSGYLSICKFENEALLRDFLNSWTWRRKKNETILRDFLIFWTWQHQKRNKSARLPQFWKLTTSKTKQFCDTFFKNGKLSAKPAAAYQCVLRFFRSTCPKYCACHEKVRPGHTKCCTTQNHLRKPEDLMFQNATYLRKSVPWPPNSSDEHVSCTAPAPPNASLQILFKCPTLAIVFDPATKPSRFTHCWKRA